MTRKITKIKDIVDWNLCVGCGACVAICNRREEQAVELVDIGTLGIRPRFNKESCGDCQDCLVVCPGFAIDAHNVADDDFVSADKDLLIGTHHGVYEGYAADQDIRYHGSSGGIITALAAYCLEQEGFDYVIHTAMDDTQPWKNTTVKSSSRQELITRAGSRYCTSSPCEWFDRIEQSDKTCVFIGKPCDAAAINMAMKIRPGLKEKVGLVLSFFCAGTPCSNAVIELAETLGAEKETIESVRFRGKGWPGLFSVQLKGREHALTKTYMDTWQTLSKRRPFRCHICPDGMSQLSDIVSGDAWNRYTGKGENPGMSHVIARTAHGRELLARAEKAGYVQLQGIEAKDVTETQGLVLRRTVVFGRIMVMKLMRVPTTDFRNFDLFKAWLRNNPFLMLISIFGTLKRMVFRGLYKKGSSYYQ